MTVGTASRKPKTALGKTPAGGAAQPGYDMATGLGSIDAAKLGVDILGAAEQGDRQCRRVAPASGAPLTDTISLASAAHGQALKLSSQERNEQ